MSQDEIPDDIRRFIHTSISSVPLLEAMILMRNAASTYWGPQALASRLYIPEVKAGGLLLELQSAGFVKAPIAGESGYRFSPVTEELADMCSRLAEIYARHMVEVTHIIHSKVDKRAQQFADAFKWRRD
ncbi:MAG: hypothetical protein HYS18_03525 [Burkholderiales bacterium]|nr:hypothetical protein [Burkholderiales bacterium]